MSRKSGRLVQVLLGLMLSFWAFSAVAECDAYASRIKQAGTDIKRITLTADAQSVDDTEAIECAFEAAATAGFGTVQLLAGDFYLSELKLQSFRGSFDGQSKANTRLHIIDNSVDCEAQVAQGREPAVISFVGGSPALRNMSIHMNEPCWRRTHRTAALVKFTGEPRTADCDTSDLIFGSVDRVALLGTGEYLDGPGLIGAGILAAAEGAGGEYGCREQLLGTFKVNRSEIDGFPRGVMTSMHGGAQVDINYNTFTKNLVGFYMFNSNQITSVSFNDFTDGSTGRFTYTGVYVVSSASNDSLLPATTAVTLLNNTFYLDASQQAYRLASAFSAVNDPRTVKVNALLRGNRLLMDSYQVLGINMSGVDGAVVIDNYFEGICWAAAGVAGVIDDEPISSDNAFLANNFSGVTSASSGADLWVGNEAIRTVIGPGQMADVLDQGTDTIITDNNLVP